MTANRTWVLRCTSMFIVMMCLSCGSSLDPEEYRAWVEDYNNGLRVSRTLGDFVFDVQYKPPYYLALQDKQFNGFNEDTLTAESDMQYFTLRIGLKDERIDFMEHNVQSEQQKSEILYYYSYRFQDQIYLEDNGKKLPCVLYHFERSYDLKTSRTFVLGFENLTQDSGSVKLVIDSPWLNTGPVKFKIDKNNIPKLKHPKNAS